MVYLPSYIALVFSLSSVAHGLSVTKRAPTTIQDTFADILPRAQAFNAAASKLSSSTTPDQYWDFLAAARGLTQVNQKDAFLGALNQPTLTDAEVSELLPVVRGTVDEIVSGMDELTSHIDGFWAIPTEVDLHLIVSSARYHISAIRWDIDSYFKNILETYPRIPASSKALIQEQATRHYDKLWWTEYTWWNSKSLPVAKNRTTPHVESWKNRILADLERRVARSADFKDYAASLTADASQDHYLLALDLEGQIWLPGVSIETWREFEFGTQTAQEALTLIKAFSSNILEGHSALTTKWDLIKGESWAKYLQILLIYETRDGTQYSQYYDNVRRLSPSSLYGDFNAFDSFFRSKWSSLSEFWYGTYNT